MSNSRLARALFAFTVIPLSLILTSCTLPFVSPPSSTTVTEVENEANPSLRATTQNTAFKFDATGYALDPRYEYGAFGTWFNYLPTDQSDFAALGNGKADSTHFQGWVTPDGQSAVLAYSLFVYTSSIAALNLSDGSVRWSVNLADYRIPTEAQNNDRPGPGNRDTHCLPDLAEWKVVCDNVGYIDTRTGAVTKIDSPADYQGIYNSGSGAFVVGNLHVASPGTSAEIAAWDMEGRQVWRLENRRFTHTGIGEDYGIVEVLAPDNAYTVQSHEVISLATGQRLFTIEQNEDARKFARVSATSQGVMATVEVASGQNGTNIFETRLYPPSGGSFQVLDAELELEMTQTPASLYQPETVKGVLSTEEVGWVLNARTKFHQAGIGSFRSNYQIKTVTPLSPASIRGAEVAGDYAVGVTATEGAFLTVNGKSLQAWSNQGAQLWDLPVSLDPIGIPFAVVPAGGYLFHIWHGHDWNTVGVTMIAPGQPNESRAPRQAVATDGSPLPTWSPSTEYLSTPERIAAATATAAGDLGGASGSGDSKGTGINGESGNPAAGTVVTRAPATIDTSSLSPIKVEGAAGSNSEVVGLQEFANDLASGNYKKIREYCWTMAPSTMDRQYFSTSSRKHVLQALAGPGQRIEGGAQWQSEGGTVVATDEELSSPYACPVFHPGGIAEPVTADDATLLMRRAIGVAFNKPIRPGDNGHYELRCGGPVGRNFAVHLQNIVDSPLIVKWSATTDTQRTFLVESKGGIVEIRQNPITSAMCLVDD